MASKDFKFYFEKAQFHVRVLKSDQKNQRPANMIHAYRFLAHAGQVKRTPEQSDELLLLTDELEELLGYAD